ncbi:solute carrier family 35 member G2 [Striga asiatica]|uniref:Solute carrier family 35 member G2 n=1 Tax=Striga asiatica TaxID=4170 RepID=A0A5A7PRQ0_STRAF|nr:solute carrier family 35 member G2 [Striga asiatica]
MDDENPNALDDPSMQPEPGDGSSTQIHEDFPDLLKSNPPSLSHSRSSKKPRTLSRIEDPLEQPQPRVNPQIPLNTTVDGTHSAAPHTFTAGTSTPSAAPNALSAGLRVSFRDTVTGEDTDVTVDFSRPKLDIQISTSFKESLITMWLSSNYWG